MPIPFRLIAVCALLAAALEVHADCTVTCTATVPATAVAGASVAFESNASPCSCAGAASYHWTFGDGAESNAQNPSHTYASASTYNWQLTVTADSTTCVKSGSIVVGNGAPVAGTYSGTTSAGLAFSLTVNGASQITAWSISFANLCGGSGSVSTSGASCAITGGAFSCGSASCIPFSTQSAVSGTFTSTTTVSGTATLKAQPGFSVCCTQTPTFTASAGGGGAALTAAASADVASGDAPLNVNFTGSATGGTGPYTYSWNFGDCSATSSAQNPSHVYAAGNWIAVLTVTDSAAATDDAVVPISAVPVGITVSPTAGLMTTEAGGTDSFSVVLQSAPDANVTIQLDTSDATEGRISTDGVTQQSTLTLTFTPSNWSTPQIVTVHGQNDALDDGNIIYTILTAAAVSTDASYNGIDPLDVSATNHDDDVAGVTVTPTTATVGENNTTDEFTVVLDTEPTNDVVIDLASNDPGEATVSPAQLTFTSSDWSSPKTVTVTGVDDALSDGDQQTTIAIAVNAAATLDDTYDAIDPADVTVTTLDDDTLSIVSTNPIANEKAAPRAANVQATATSSVSAATITQTTFRVQGEQTGRIAGAYSASGPTFQLNPANDLKPGELIRVTATSGIQTPAAVALTPRVWQFTAATSTSTGALMLTSSFQAGNPISVAIGDLDGDGDLDAIFANVADAPETVWKNDGTGTLTQFASFGTGDSYDVALGDLDGDGDLDAFVGNRLSDDTIWSNDGTGIFTLRDSVSSDWTSDVALGDLDRDGDLDAVLGNNSGACTVWLNDGTGDFSAHPATPDFGTGNANAVALGDIDGDGDLDALVAQQNGAERVWVNDGTGAFAAHSTPSFGGDNSWDIVTGDLDGDGDLDAVVANQGTQPETVWLNSGSGVFAAHGSFGAGDSHAMALGDLDGDGDLDAIVANAGGNETIWRNDGTGAFTAHAAVPGIAGGDGWGVALADLDNDGDLDAIVTNAEGGGNETVWLNERIVVAPIAGLTTTEAGTTSSFTIVLGRAPTADMTIHLATSDASEGRISSDAATQQDALDLTFTTANWSTPRTITLHGQNDALDDGNVPYTIVVNAAASSDAFYSGVDPHDVAATNMNVPRFNIIATTPAANAKSAARNTNVSATTNDTVNASTVTQSTFRVHGDFTGRVAGTYSASGASFQLDPAANVKPGETIHLTATSGIQNATGVGLDRRVSQFTAAAGAATGVMTEQASSPFGGGWSFDGALGDLDGDGDLDVIIANPDNENETVWLNDGSGAYTTQPATSSFEAGGTRAVTLGDIDGDGDLDAVFACYGTNTTWLNDGSGNFSAHPGTPAFGSGDNYDVALGDLDGDGDLDAGIASLTGSLTIWSNDGAGNFAAHPTTPLIGAGSIDGLAFGDLDADGDLDAVAVSYFHPETVWLNDGAGNLSAHPVTPSFDGGAANGVALGDVNGDGDLDMVLANWGGAEAVYSNDGGGNFAATSTFGATDTRAITLGDLDGDGDLDAITTDSGHASVWRNDGSGAFSAHPVTATFGGDEVTVRLGDLDGDGDLDALLINPNADHVWINSNNAPFGAPPAFSATATGTTQVALAWGSVANATAYEIYRTTSVSVAYSLVTSVAGTSFTDTGRSANTTYLYKVRAMNGATPSPDSLVEAATTTVFTDPTLTTSTTIKATHITQLRTAVNAMRAAANLSAATFTDPTISASARIKRVHLTDLRAALDPARSTIGLGALTYTDPTITAGTTKIKAAHVSELREGTQ